jgi:hypothetical protein
VPDPDDGALAAERPQVGLAALDLVVLHKGKRLVEDDELGLIDDRTAEEDERLVGRRKRGKRLVPPRLGLSIRPEGGEEVVDPGNLCGC